MRRMAPRRMPGMTVTDLIPIHEDDPGGSADSQYSMRESHESLCLERPGSSLQRWRRFRMTELYVVKHVADRVANEPRNVGVIAATGRGADSWVATRFLGVDLDGTSARRPLPGVPKNIYLAWVNYFRVKTREDRWEDIARARRRRPQDFCLDHVLTILDSDDVERIADEYFSRLVQAVGRRRPGRRRRIRCDRAEAL